METTLTVEELRKKKGWYLGWGRLIDSLAGYVFGTNCIFIKSSGFCLVRERDLISRRLTVVGNARQHTGAGLRVGAASEEHSEPGDAKEETTDTSGGDSNISVMNV
jgi:hypothetical protein